jgi:hypothetical protein
METLSFCESQKPGLLNFIPDGLIHKAKQNPDVDNSF